MSTRNRTPSLLEPFLRLPPETSLILLTGTLGCSANWLTALFVSSVLYRDQNAPTVTPKVVLVSWLRDLSFWKSEVRRTTGLDISKSIAHGHLIFLDCLSTALRSSTKGSLSDAEASIAESITKISNPHASDDTNGTQQTILILDAPDVLLATASAAAQELNNLILKLQSTVHSTILSCSADLPLLSAASPENLEHVPLPLEVETANHLVQQAHLARMVLSVRELDTGAAKDVSGVLRVTRGGSCYGFEEDEENEGSIKEIEALYLVQRDGNVKVFQRGTDIR